MNARGVDKECKALSSPSPLCNPSFTSMLKRTFHKTKSEKRPSLLWSSFATCGPTPTLSPVSFCIIFSLHAHSHSHFLTFLIQCICQKKKKKSPFHFFSPDMSILFHSFPLVEMGQLFIYYQQSFTEPLDLCSWVVATHVHDLVFTVHALIMY